MDTIDFAFPTLEDANVQTQLHFSLLSNNGGGGDGTVESSESALQQGLAHPHSVSPSPQRGPWIQALPKEGH